MSKVYLRGAFLNKSAVEIKDGRWYFFDEEPDAETRKKYEAKYGTEWGEVHLQGARLRGVPLQDCLLYEAHLEEADLGDAHLEGADFWHAHLEGANFHTSVVDGSTLFWHCTVNRETDLRGMAVEGARIDAETKELFLYNVRRTNWERWYEEHRKLAWLVRSFWWTNDYGLSTGRVLASFFLLAIVFATIYYASAIVRSPGLVNSLLEGKEGIVPPWLVPIRAVYFSVVTMTTLGFRGYARELSESARASVAHHAGHSGLCAVGCVGDSVCGVIYGGRAGGEIRGTR